MTQSRAGMPRNPYLDYDAQTAAEVALACLQCDPAPCVGACPQRAEIVQVMRLTRRAACAGLPLARWLLSADALESARVADQICDAYA